MIRFFLQRGLTALRLAMLLPIVGIAAESSSEVNLETNAHARREAVRNTFGTYDAEPRQSDGRVDIERLVRELTEIKARTYNFLIWHGSNDWSDLQLFLPRAREHAIQVWVTLVPPSESPPHAKTFSEPFRLDYERWAIEIAQLSRRETNLVAWSVDDFAYNAKTFTPEYLQSLQTQAHTINPRLAFVPCLYYRQLTPEFASKYRPLFDGLLFPYRHESAGSNLSEWDTLPAEVARIRELFGPTLPILVDVYATRHSRLGDSTPEYVKRVMELGREHADGVLIYCHQYADENPAKHAVIKQLFQTWSRKP